MKGGLLVTGRGIQRGDILIKDGLIQRIVPEGESPSALRVIDASGRYVLPGIIDAHCHPVYADRMDTFTRSAAFGGITTIIPFIGALRAWGLSGRTSDVVRDFIQESERTSYLDFGVHAAFTAEDDVERELPLLMEMGVLSFKMFMAYPRRGMMMPDDRMLRVMALAAEMGGIAMVHAENGYLIDFLVDRLIARGRTGNEYFLPSQPNIAEVEAVFRATIYAAVTRCPLYFVHLSAREVPQLLLRFKAEGVKVYGETCPQYLTLTDEEVQKHGPLAKVGPPLRRREDNEAMWEGLRNGALDAIGSDSCNLTREQKETSMVHPPTGGEVPRAGNILEARFGAPTAEEMLPVVYHEGVNRGRLSLTRLVQVMSENPAKLFGLYPRKGALLPGSDADLVVFDPSVRHTLSAQAIHRNADYTLFEGLEVLGKPVLSIQRGEVVLEGGEVVRPPGRARYLPGNRELAAYAPKGYPVE